MQRACESIAQINFVQYNMFVISVIGAGIVLGNRFTLGTTPI